LYARNLLDFLKLILTQDGGVAIPADDDIVTATLVTRDGAVLRT
jgi:NAD(P) transhydrogenase subunit alpha